jgi:ribosomal protein S18 acetylase RimI-like enzyme
MKLNFIKVTNIEDLLRIEQLARTIWPSTFKDIITTEQIDFMLNWMYSLQQMQKEIKLGTIYELVYYENKTIGFCGYTKHSNINAIKMDKIYILPENQGMGIGSKVISHICEYTKEQGFHSVVLAVNKKNSSAINAYKKNRFKIIESVKNDIGNGFFMDDYIMERKNSAV